jgi:hypothetical protein
MPEVSTPPAATPTVDRNAVRIVLFGMPDAGKSSLLGALAQAAQTQEHVLNGRLVDRSQGLAQLQRRLYQEQPRETLEEVVPYSVTLEPFTSPESSAAPAPLDAVLVDCDGRVANELLGEQHSVSDEHPDSALAKAILDADTLVLVVDASANPKVVERDFEQFAHFLRLLEHDRGRRSDIGGLPVYLVLTKCDLLAQKGDTSIAWMDRIEEHKRQVHGLFQEFLARKTEEDSMPFGQIELHVWATAVKRPALADAPAKPREPYGVAELFRQCFESARDFRQRCTQAGRRLNLTVGAAVGVVALLMLLTAFLLFNRPGPEINDLRDKIEQFRDHAGNTASERLDKKSLQASLTQLREFKEHPAFGKLPPELQKYVNDSLDELKAYQSFTAKLEEIARHTPRLSAVQNEEQLKEIEDMLHNAAPPAAYERAWAETKAVLVRNEWLRDTEALRKAIKAEVKWFGEQTKKGKQLHKEGLLIAADDKREGRPEWLDRVKKYLATPEPHEKTDPIVGARLLTYRTVLEFKTVQEAREEWQKVKKRLEDVRKLVES